DGPGVLPHQRPTTMKTRGQWRVTRDAAKAVEGRPPPSRHPSPVTCLSRAFTLVELLMVIAIIAILSAMLLPVLHKSKLSAQRVECMNHLRQLGIAAQLYWDENGGACFQWIYDSSNSNGHQYWFGWLQNDDTAEGQRAFDLSAGVLF